MAEKVALTLKDDKGANKDYSLVVLRVTAWDAKGRPSAAVIGYDDTTFDLTDDKVSREFVTAFMPTNMTETKTAQ
jgi:hypothetical protein